MLADIKLLLGITDDGQDGVLQIMIDDARSAVRDYCNRKDFPEQAGYVVRELVINAFLQNNEGNVTSVKRGDTQISYGQVITKGSLTELHRMALNRYKKVRME